MQPAVFAIGSVPALSRALPLDRPLPYAFDTPRRILRRALSITDPYAVSTHPALGYS